MNANSDHAATGSRFSDDEIRLIEKGRKNFMAMAITYCLGVFNDNFFKQAIILLAVQAQKVSIQSMAVVVFTLPYLLVTAPAGWMADKFPKRSIVIGSKVLELIAMISGAIGIIMLSPGDTFYHASWILTLVMLGIMGMQSSFFSPALNGSLPELYPASYVTRANGIVKMVTTVAILAGVAVAGEALSVGARKNVVPTPVTIVEPAIVPSADLSHAPDAAGVSDAPENLRRHGRFIAKRAIPDSYNQTGLKTVAVIIVFVSLLGLLISFGVPKRPAAGTTDPFPWDGPVNAIRELVKISHRRLLNITVWGNVFFWFTGGSMILIVPNMAMNELGYGQLQPGLLLAMQMVGVAVGAILADRFSKGKNWYTVLPPTLVFMALSMFFLSIIPALSTESQLPDFYIGMLLLGVSGGLYLIPLESYIQVEPAPDNKGRVISAANFAAMAGVMLSGPFYYLLAKIGLAPSQCFAVLGGMALVVLVIVILSLNTYEKRHGIKRSVYAGKTILIRLLHFGMRCILRLRYRWEISGMEDVAKKGTTGILFVANHPALVDPILMQTILFKRFFPRSVADESRVSSPLIAWLADRIGVRKIPDVSRVGAGSVAAVRAALDESIDGLKRGENLLLYPAGRLKRQREERLGATSAVETILSEYPDVRVVIIRQNGLWGSLSSWAGKGDNPRIGDLIRAALTYFPLNLLFFMPRRTVRYEFIEPVDFPKHENRIVINKYLEDCFNENAQPNTAVPYGFWETGGTRDMPEPGQAVVDLDLSGIAAETQERVFHYLADLTGRTDITSGMNLAGDLGLDSLMLTDVVLWIEAEFGYSQADTDSLETVADVILAAAGRGVSTAEIAVTPPSKGWFSPSDAPAKILGGDTIPAAFLARAKSQPDRVIIADQISGEKTYRDIVLSVMVLSPVIRKMDGDYIGVMFPAGVGATIVYLATLFSGKIPVMVNWTAGSRNMRHSLDLLNVHSVITARKLITKLTRAGTELDALQDRFVFIEDIGKSLSGFSKLAAVLKSRLTWGMLEKASVPETAVVLFTSGSESLPKAVPLTHTNILTNIRDIQDSVALRESHRMIGILPPFHSFGITVTMVLPLVSGLPVAYHPNPTEAKILGRLIENNRISLLVATPTFVSGILRYATDAQLQSLELIVTGAEKCSESLAVMIQRRVPGGTVLEGYGVTECSPVVSVNPLRAPKRNTIGKILPALDYKILDVDTGECVSPGEKGVLVVSGDSVFQGYLNYDGASPFVEIDGRKWYRTGDLVVEDADGYLTFKGRLKRFIKLGGEMISLPAIEDILAERFRDDAVDGPVLAVEASASDENPQIVLFATIPIEKEAANACLRDAGLSALSKIHRVRRVDAIPLLGTGKTDYRALKKHLGDG